MTCSVVPSCEAISLPFRCGQAGVKVEWKPPGAHAPAGANFTQPKNNLSRLWPRPQNAFFISNRQYFGDSRTEDSLVISQYELEHGVSRPNQELRTNSYESMTQATPRASAELPPEAGSSVRMTRPRHWITTSSFPPVTSGGSGISNSTGDPISRLASARM